MQAYVRYMLCLHIFGVTSKRCVSGDSSEEAGQAYLG